MNQLFQKFLTCIGLGIVCILLLTIGIQLQTNSRIYTSIKDIPHTQVALILGTSVLENGDLSPILKDRVNAAIILYKAKKIEKIIVSGDNSTTTYNEVEPMKDYLVEHGIPESNIFLDYAGFDTYSSLYRARDIFLVGSTTIISQSFHLPRALFIAENLGITAYGFDADAGKYLLKNYLREMLANIKAVYNLIAHTKPKYFGEIIPIGEN